MKKWNIYYNQIKESSPPDIILVIAANKSDLIDHEAVDEEEARKFAEELGAILVSTTARQIEPINDLFIQIAKKYTGSNEITIKEEEDYPNEKWKINKSILELKEKFIATTTSDINIVKEIWIII